MHKLTLTEMVEWEEWEWEENVQAMPLLEEFLLESCKLRCTPVGLASHAKSLKKLYVHDVQHLNSLENLAAVVELEVYDNPDLMRIANFSKLWKLDISGCQKLKVLDGADRLRHGDTPYIPEGSQPKASADRLHLIAADFHSRRKIQP
jgi:hypothetical protein